MNPLLIKLTVSTIRQGTLLALMNNSVKPYIQYIQEASHFHFNHLSGQFLIILHVDFSVRPFLEFCF